MKLARSEMTDTQKFWADVNRAGEEGAHSHDLANSIPSLNVSQRAKDCASKGQEVFTASEGRNGRNGARYWIGAHNAPDYAVPVRPNERGSEVGSGSRYGEAAPVSHDQNAVDLTSSPTAPTQAAPVKPNGPGNDGNDGAVESDLSSGAPLAAIVLDFRKKGQEQRGERLANGTRVYWDGVCA